MIQVLFIKIIFSDRGGSGAGGVGINNTMTDFL